MALEIFGRQLMLMSVILCSSGRLNKGSRIILCRDTSQTWTVIIFFFYIDLYVENTVLQVISIKYIYLQIRSNDETEIK